MMKNILSILFLVITSIASKAQDKITTETKTPAKWAIRPNYDLKGDIGLLTISLPEQTAVTATIVHSGETKNLYTWHSSTSRELAPGTYDITFWNIKIPSVVVEKGKETRILSGVLNSTVKKPWEVWTVEGEKVFGAGSAKKIALPAGKYIVKTSGAEIKTTIIDGQTSIFSFTAY
jgi:hypothetical protein